MSNLHLHTALQALHRIFVLPNLLERTSTLPPAAFPRSTVNSRAIAPLVFSRTLTYIERQKLRKTTSSAKLDERIASVYVNFVTPENEFLPLRKLSDVISGIDRETHHIVQVADGNRSASDPKDRIPVVKLIRKQELFEQALKQAEIKRTNKKKSVSGKTIELSWSIDGNDLSHRLRKAQEFLDEGRKVDVVLAPKKRGKVVSEKECEELLDKIKGEFIGGTKEYKDAEGKIGGLLTLFFEPDLKKRKNKAPEADA
ncbi:hypothetical protein K402DRAFT_332864 [Aulographum hederae CBS 113979]|uniref:Translation initiation factor 3 N-terminal domain-containing protein n=1 Tax=Aulographum hederae CBS 113979 TaxID=1176131 RepID=A0A6G1GZS2_9PEZI|nr:hypothetical protein K402DRAFT_332864 [Aulographum hederae CBS 113979]